MDSQRDTPLQTGDRVRDRDFTFGGTGVVLKCLSHEYVLIKWRDVPVALARHRFGVKKVTADEASVAQFD